MYKRLGRERVKYRHFFLFSAVFLFFFSQSCRQAEKEARPLLDMSASDGIFYRVQIFTDLTLKGYTRNNLIMITPNDLSITGKVSKDTIADIISSIESTGFHKISSDLVSQEIKKHYGRHLYFAGRRGYYSKVKSLDTADNGRRMILHAIKLLINLPTIRVQKNQ